MPGPTIAYQYIESQPPQCAKELHIAIDERDCLEVAYSIAEKTGQPVCVLNIANQFNVGGDYLNMVGGQEESLIKRTDLLESLLQLEGIKGGNVENPHKYELSDRLGFSTPQQRLGFGEFTCLYSPDITVNNWGEAHDAPSRQLKVNVISSAAYNLTERDAPDEELYTVGTILKIVNQLRTAKAHGQRHLVLGAFGCGAFHNSPQFIAEIYHSAISEYEFQGCFDSISFSIMTARDATKENYQAFSQTFAFPSRPLLYQLLKLKSLLNTEEHEIKKMLAPFLTIKTSDELRFLVLRELDTEIQLSKKPSMKQSKKIEVLESIKELVDKHPDMTQQLIRCILSSELLASVYNTHSRSALFKSQPLIITKLQLLLQAAPPILPLLNPTQHELAKTHTEDFILAKTEELIACCETDEDKTSACFLIYVACSKAPGILQKNLVGRLENPSYQIIKDLLKTINLICLGKSTHAIQTCLIDPRIYDGKKTEEILTSYGQHVKKSILSLLLTKYKNHFNLSDCEAILDTTIFVKPLEQLN